MAEPAPPPVQEERSTDDTLWTIAVVIMGLAVLVNLVNWALVEFGVKPGPVDGPVPVPLIMAMLMITVVRIHRRKQKSPQG